MIHAENQKWWGLAALIPTLSMAFVEQTVLPVALPTIQREFGSGNGAMQWCVNSYLLAIAILTLVGGKISDRIGHRKGYILGILLFAVASLLCGLSFGALSLIAARCLQGVGAALLFPSSNALFAPLFPPQERGKATGIYVSVSSLFLILGPLIGGYFTEAFSWRMIFWINLPIATLSIILAFWMFPASPKGQGKIDLWGFIFFAVSCGFFVLYLMNGAEWGWISKAALLLVALFVLSGICLFWREKKAPHPFLDLSLFKHPVYKAVNISIWAAQFILMIAVFRAIYFQNVLLFSPLETGVLTTVCSLPVLFVSPIGGLLSDRFGPKLPIAIGFLLLIFSFFWFGFLPLPKLWQILLPLFAFGFGVPLILTPSYSSAINVIPQQKLGIAFGMISTFRNLGSTLGVAAIGASIESIRSLVFRSETRADPATRSLDPSLLNEIIGGKSSVPEALKGFSPGTVRAAEQHFRTAEMAGFSGSHLAIGILLILSFAAVFVLYHRKSAHHLPETPSEGWD